MTRHAPLSRNLPPATAFLLCVNYETHYLLGKERDLDMTADKFRSLALALPTAFESAHMGHADFRIEGKIFASLGYPDESFGMVKLTPEQQRSFMKKAPGVFDPCAGAWGRGGATSVHLSVARVEMLRAALEAASKNVASHAKKKKG